MKINYVSQFQSHRKALDCEPNLAMLRPLERYTRMRIFCFDFDFCTVSLLVIVKYEGFVKKIFLIGPLWGEVGLFRVVLRLRGSGNETFV